LGEVAGVAELRNYGTTEQWSEGAKKQWSKAAKQQRNTGTKQDQRACSLSSWFLIFALAISRGRHMPKQNTQPFQIALIITEPPDSALGEFGIQDRNQSLHAGKPFDGGLKLYCTIEARFSQESVDFRGQFVHGPVGDRFVYLAWRGPDGNWRRRMKVQLGGITTDMINAANDKTLVARIRRIDSSRAKLQTADWVAE
jgi:hypothetical protein